LGRQGSRAERQIRGALRCAADDKIVRCFGRDDGVSWGWNRGGQPRAALFLVFLLVFVFLLIVVFVLVFILIFVVEVFVLVVFEFVVLILFVVFV